MCRWWDALENPLFSLWQALWHSTTTASCKISCRKAEESRTSLWVENYRTSCNNQSCLFDYMIQTRLWHSVCWKNRYKNVHRNIFTGFRDLNKKFWYIIYQHLREHDIKYLKMQPFKTVGKKTSAQSKRQFVKAILSMQGMQALFN